MDFPIKNGIFYSYVSLPEGAVSAWKTAVSVPNDGSAQAAHCQCYGKRPVGSLSFRVILKLVVSQGGH